MKINPSMNLDDLAERLGTSATEQDASIMRDLLVASHDGEDTADISEDEWLRLCEQTQA